MTGVMASGLPFADPTKKVSPEDFELLSVLGTGGETFYVDVLNGALGLVPKPADVVLINVLMVELLGKGG